MLLPKTALMKIKRKIFSFNRKYILGVHESDPVALKVAYSNVFSPAGEGWGSPNSDDWRKSLALCLLCGK
jgi:hypothetical protein